MSAPTTPHTTTADDAAGAGTHPVSCACAGRGWFVEHAHQDSCDDHDCVGCIRSTIACDEETLVP